MNNFILPTVQLNHEIRKRSPKYIYICGIQVVARKVEVVCNKFKFRCTIIRNCIYSFTYGGVGGGMANLVSFLLR